MCHHGRRRSGVTRQPVTARGFRSAVVASPHRKASRKLRLYTDQDKGDVSFASRQIRACEDRGGCLGVVIRAEGRAKILSCDWHFGSASGTLTVAPWDKCFRLGSIQHWTTINNIHVHATALNPFCQNNSYKYTNISRSHAKRCHFDIYEFLCCF